MGEDRRGVVLAMPVSWVTALLCVIPSVCAVEGRCAQNGTVNVQMMPDEDLNNS